MGDEDNVGQVDDLGDIDLSTIGVEPEAEASPAADTNSGGENPAWAPILESVPEELREALKPKLQDWDKGVQSRFQKIHQEYDGYKPFKEQGIAPEDLQRSLQIRQQIDQDPVGFFERLGGYLRANGLIQEAQQADAQARAAAQSQADDDPENPIARLERQQQELVQRLESQREEEMQRQAQEYAYQQVQNEYQEVEQKYGTLSPVMRQELFQRATLLTNIAEQQGKEPPTLMEAMDSLQTFISQVSKARRPAPRVVPSHGGGLPAVQGKDPAELSPQDRSQAAQALIDSILNG